MKFWRGESVRSALTAFVLLFALQVIAAPGLCTVHDEPATSSQGSAGIEGGDSSNLPALRVHQSGAGDDAALPLQAPSDSDGCDAPALPAADSQTLTFDVLKLGFNMAPAPHQAALAVPAAAMATPGRWASLSPPPQRSTLDVAPRLRI